MDKVYRRTQILEILGSGTAATQTELRKKLAHRGVHVTQATVSRDIEELGLVKTREGYRLPDAARTAAPNLQPGMAVVLKEFVREVRQAANFIIVRTHPGTAHTVAVALDAAEWPEVAGTVAGDDTIFVATEKASDAGRVRKRILAQLAD
jgi:transcriptional regulator of arginine metabolism